MADIRHFKQGRIYDTDVVRAAKTLKKMYGKYPESLKTTPQTDWLEYIVEVEVNGSE